MQQGRMGRCPGHCLAKEQQPCQEQRFEPLHQPVDPIANGGQGKGSKDQVILGDQGPSL
jgi:hypothetical protein